MRVVNGGPPVDQLLAPPNIVRQRVGDFRGQLRQRVVHKNTLHLRRQVPGLFVHRDDASRVQHLLFRFRRRVRTVGVRFGGHDLVLRVLHLQPVRGELELPEQNDALMRTEDVL